MSLDGSYNFAAQSPIGKQTGTFTFITDGDVLTGVVEGQGDPSQINKGVVSDNELRFEFDGNSPIGKMKMQVQAVVEGDSINGTIRTRMGAMKFEGMRA